MHRYAQRYLARRIVRLAVGGYGLMMLAALLVLLVLVDQGVTEWSNFLPISLPSLVLP
jgi:hypothetical protein